MDRTRRRRAGPWLGMTTLATIVATLMTNDAPAQEAIPDAAQPPLRKMSDTDLERHFIDARQGYPFTDDVRHDADTCLTEMIERGGPRWEKFIARQLDVSRKHQRGYGSPGDDVAIRPIEDVALLTALRRVQHKSDPVVLEVVGGPVIETVFPTDPVIHYRVKNVDLDGESIALWTWELAEYGMNSYCRIDVHASDGSIVPHDDDRKLIGQGIARRVEISPDASADSTVGLEYFVHLPRPDEYQAILHQRHGHAGNEFACSKGPIDGWICSSSETFTIRVLPHPIDVPKSERERLLDRFHAIDLSQPTPLVWQPWRVDDEFTAAVTSPQDELYFAGWTAVPVLLDVLDDEHSTARARAWALALLADVTGLNGLSRRDDKNRAWGRFRRFDCWPGLKRPQSDQAADKSRQAEGPDEPDLAQQTELIHRWNETRNNFVVHE